MARQEKVGGAKVYYEEDEIDWSSAKVEENDVVQA